MQDITTAGKKRFLEKAETAYAHWYNVRGREAAFQFEQALIDLAPWCFEMIRSELERRERAEKGYSPDYWKLTCRACGFKRIYHPGADGMGACPNGFESTFQLVESPVTDGEAPNE